MTLKKKLNTYLARFEQKKKRKLTPIEKYSIRLGWMSTGLIMIAPHLLPSTMGITIYILAGILGVPQVLVAKQWNLVLVNLNVILAYGILLSKTM